MALFPFVYQDTRGWSCDRGKGKFRRSISVRPFYQGTAGCAWVYLSVLSVYLSVCLSVPVCLFVYLFICVSMCLSFCLPVCLFACPSPVPVPVCLFLSVYESICLSACLCLSVCRSACLKRVGCSRCLALIFMYFFKCLFTRSSVESRPVSFHCKACYSTPQTDR